MSLILRAIVTAEYVVPEGRESHELLSESDINIEADQW